MKKAVIIYGSTHHGNTYKLVKALSDRYQIDIIDATKETKKDIASYDLVGFASGIDFGRFYSSVEKFLENNLPGNKQVFFIYTCAKVDAKFTKSITEKAVAKNATVLGEYGCKGYNTYGPLKLIGGMNKNHPDKMEIEDAFTFYESIAK